MGKKLLFLNLFLFAILLPTSGMAQECPSSVSISSDAGTTICEGTNVTFTATPTNGTNITYEWFIENVSSGTGASISTTALTNNDKVKVVAKSTDNTVCATTSNILTITVNTVRVPSVSISASATTICPGENIQFTAAPINGGNSPAYNWKVDGSSVQNGSSNTFSSTSLINGQSVTVELTSNATCAAPTTAISDPIVIAVQPGTPSVPTAIQGEASVCPGTSSLVYSVPAVTNATEYIWSLPNGWSGTSTTNSISVTSGATGTGTITVKAKNSCGTSAAETLNVTVKAGTPATPGTITGDAQVCPGKSKTYSIAAVTGATEYIWTFPSGWSGSSNTNSIDLTTGTSGNGTITVKAINDCGTSAAKILAVSVKPGTPAVPSTISGNIDICPGTTNTYSIAAVANATSYEWILPNGWTGTSSTTSINAISNSSGGDIKVKAINDCGTSAFQTLPVTIKAGTPATPSAISGSNTVCPGTSEIYLVTNNPDASEYIWTLPNGWTGSSNTSTITVNTGTSGSGNITVKAINDCGTSAVAATIAVSVKAPAPVMSGTISGPATVCSGSSGLVYTIPAIANADSYIWTLPNGSTVTTQTGSISTTAGSSGNISVIAKNSCGDSSPSANFAVSATAGVPATPGEIFSSLAANPNICPPATGITFRVDPVGNATGYNWIMPAGWEIISGANTNSITARANANTPFPATQSVKVEATNICGSSGQSAFNNIIIDDHVSATIGADQTVCKVISPITINATVGFAGKKLSVNASSNGTGSFSGVPNGNADVFNFIYTPSQNDIDTKTQVVITLTTEKPNGACSAGKDEMIIFFKPDPSASIAGTSTICTGNATDITFTGTPNSIVTYKKNGGADQTIAVGASGNATLNTGALTANTTYSLVSVKHAAAPDCPKTITGSAIVTITAKPTATISYSASPYNKCINTGQPVTLSGTGAYQNGVYSAPAGLSIDTSKGEILPSASAAGTYIVTYTTPASGGCLAVATTTSVTINEIPTITLSYAGTPFCTNTTNSRTPSLSGTGNYQGGTYTGNNGLIINATSGVISNSNIAGNYTVTYSITPSASCTPITQSVPVVITENPVPVISYTAVDFCKSVNTEQLVNLSGSGDLTGGTFSAPSGLTLDSSSGAINPSSSTAGTYKVTYTIAAANGCGAATAETTVNISEIPSAAISYAGPFCQSDATGKDVSFSNTAGAYQAGGFTGTVGLTIDANTGKISPNSSQSGTHTVTYTIPPSGGCAEVKVTTEVTITPQPAATITYNGPYCSSETSPQAVSFSGTAGVYTTGVFSGTNGLSIASDGSINPSSSTKGTHTVTYTIPSADGCGDVVSTTDIEIFEQVIITNQPSNVGICSTQSATFEVVASGDNLTYQWKRTDGAAITNATGITTSKLKFNNATSINAGEYFVEISGNAACPSLTASDTVSLNIDENIIIIKPVVDETFCENDKTVQTFEYIAHANGAELTFVWIKDGVELPTNNPAKYSFNKTGPDGADGEYSGTLTISDLVVADNGKYAVKITGPDSFTCSEATSKTFTLSIKDQPDAPLTTDITYCQYDNALALNATDKNGITLDPITLKWYKSEFGDDLITGTPTPLTTAVGSISYWVSQTPSECESPRAELVVTIKEKPGKPALAPNTKLTYCLNEIVTTPLGAIGDSGNTINWYNAVDATTALGSAPVPNTSTDVTTNYWVSQTKNDCESDRLQVSITVNPLPNVTATASAPIICKSTSTDLNAAGAATYNWVVKGATVSLGTTASLSVSPASTTTYIVTGTNAFGCSSSAEVTIQVDEQTIAPTITSSASAVCITSNSGNLSITGSGYVGEIQRWESSTDNGTTWNPISNTTENLPFSNLTQTTKYRVAVKNGVCSELLSAPVEVKVDLAPIGGKLLFNNSERIYLTCESPTAGSLSPITISLQTGNIVAWKYRKTSANTWTTIQANNANFTGTTLSSAQIFALGVTETMVFQVEIASGSCTPNVLSQTAILSVIPSDIEPTPVTIDPDVICFGDEVTLNSSTGYGNPLGKIDGGAFDNAGLISEGWRFYNKKDPSDTGFDTDANNTRPDRWKRATRHQFTTASITSPFTTREDLYISSNGENNPSGNKGFAVVSSNHEATMETPVFSIGGLDQAILTWDQMFNLTPGASIKVEVSTDGGNTYNNILYSVGTPPNPPNTTGIKTGNFDGFAFGAIGTNKMKADLGYYMGQQNLRIRFSYVGKRIGDVWAVDNISIPDGPRGVDLVWYDYTDPANPIYIGNSETETWTPSKIGWNEFEVRTKLLLDSSGQACQSIENFERVKAFAFDKYVSTTTLISGTCGNSYAQLTGVVEGTGSINGGPTQGVITSFPTLDGYTAIWTVVGPSGYTFSESHFTSANGIEPATKDPKAVFNPEMLGDFTLTWTLVPTALNDDGILISNEGCPPTYTPATVSTLDCTTLDFDGVDDYVDLGTTFTGNYSIEAWVRPESDNGTIISGPNFEISLVSGKVKYNSKTFDAALTSNSRWYHIAATSNGELYVDGILIDSGAGTGGGFANTIIGAKWNATTSIPENYFSGWIEEVRIWNKTLSQDQIQFMMNQRIQLNAAANSSTPIEGEVVPNRTVAGSYLIDNNGNNMYFTGSYDANNDQILIPFYDQTWGDLAGYYRLISADPDPAGLQTFDNALKPQSGITPDLALNAINGRLYNMTTDQQNTAPLPYISANDGIWSTNSTWLRPTVWDAPNSIGVKTSTRIDWNIARINHNIDSGDRDITMLGLKSQTINKRLEISGPGTKNEYNTGQSLRVTHYLELDGNIDLVGESQLLQDQGSILEETSKGWLERDQQGQANSFIYNYWSSPVSKTGDLTNNAPYSILDVMKYGTNSNSPTNFNLVNGPFSADDAALNSSTYWFWRFHGLADDYDSWIYIGDDLGGKKLNTGEAHTMKGVNGGMSKDATQNYVYKGKPHNGDITLTINPDENYLIGNPYPSALNGREFILDNIKASGGRNSINSFNGTIYFWDHFETTNHNLREYIGGYAVLNLLAGVPAASIDERIDNSNPYSGRSNQKIPNHYIPVGQGFFISTVHDAISDTTIVKMGGDFIFKNSQRVYKRENGTDNSIFLRPEIPAKPSKEALTNKEEDKFEKIRLSFLSPKGYNRQILVGAHPATTNGFDMGYDAPMIDYNVEDMYWLQAGEFLVIQGVPDFGKDQILPIGIRIDKEGEFKIKIDTLEHMKADHTIYLKDKVLDTIHDLRSGPYTSTSEPGEITDRFQLIFYKEQATPDPIVVEEPIIDDFSEISLLHSYSENEMMVLNPQELEISVIHLFDLNGKLLEIFDEVPSESEIRLKVSNYSEGIYILKMHTDNEIITRKIIIKK